MVTAIEKEYFVQLDTKNRFTLRGAKTKFYRVKVLKDGHLILSPQKLVPTARITSDTLQQIIRSIGNLKRGKVGEPVNLKAARQFLHE